MGVIPQPVPTGATSGNCVNYTAVSEIFTFNLGCIPSRSSNQHLQLMWQNRYGHYDYYTFMAGRYQGIGIDRQTYNQWNIDWGSADPNKTQYSRGLTDSQVVMAETVVVHTGFINQPDFEFLEELYTSSQVYEIQPNGGLRPVNIISTEFEKKIQGNKTIFDLELTFVYSNNIELLGK
jgi:hypothetical protein